MISRKWLPVILLDLLALLVAAASVLGQTAPKGPHVNGYWQVQPGIYVPCTQIKPFQPFVNTPGDGNTYYLGGDVNANIPHPNLFGTTIDAIYYNHTRAAYDAQGFITPLFPQLGPINYYPAPSTAAQLCSQYAGFGNALTCPTATDAQYTQKFLTNAVWTQSYAVYLPQIQADCNGPQPTNTPTRTATAAPTPTPTPTPGPNPYAQYIEALKRYGVSAGCGGGNFCPSFNITREQLATWLVKASQAGPMTLAPCMTPPAFNDVICNSAVTAKVGP